MTVRMAHDSPLLVMDVQVGIVERFEEDQPFGTAPSGTRLPLFRAGEALGLGHPIEVGVSQ